jgi:signal transduction histidine kinase
VINGLTAEIRETTANETIEEYAGRILDLSNRIDEITEQIRELDRLREETDVSNPVDIVGLLDRIVDSSATEETTVRLQCEDGLVAKVNETLLTLVIEQLLENAVKHGGDTVTLSASEATDPEPGIVFVVDDDGPGISPDEYEPVLKRTTNQLNHSTGIGLLIIRWGIDELGGELEFESDDDGTTVKFWIPADT